MLSQLIHAARSLARDYATHTASHTGPASSSTGAALSDAAATTASHAPSIAAATAAAQNDPLSQLHQRLLSLPQAYHSAVERQQHYARFLRGLTEFEALTATLTADSARRVLEQLSPNFELAYLGCDVTAALQQYGRSLQRLAAIAWPQWSAPLQRQLVTTPRRLRIGYVSAHLHIHSASLLAYGWMTSHNREQFDVHVFHVGDKYDVLTGKLAHECEHFMQPGSSLEAACTQIAAAELDILIYVDIGMEMLTTLMASLRLAPMQCATWAHPISTGLPNIDVFISNAAMEPPNSQQHYCEQLLLLPGIGACLQAPWLAPLKRTRQDFALDNTAVVYVSLQPLNKYLAEHDDLFAAIAARVPNACFLLMEAETAELTDVLRQRLIRTFADAGMDATQYLRWLSRMDYDRYLDFLQLADVFLDPPGAWSAGITASEAIACALPLVTWPGDFLRSRQAYGMLSVLGITDTIARNRADYIAIATRLGNERDFNTAVRSQLQQRQSPLFGDTSCMRPLEAFFLANFYRR